MKTDRAILRFHEAAAILPVRFRKTVLSLSDEQKRTAEEFRLRAGHPLTVLLPEGELETDQTVTCGDLDVLCDLATEFSRYAAAETIREGYLAVRGGFRIGLCGSAVMKDGVNRNLRDISGAALRIAREKRGIAASVLPALFCRGRFCSTLILAPPGGGKTTLLRELVRCLSDGADGFGAHRVALVDERGEVAVLYRGQPQMDVGSHTDVLDGCPKALAIPMLLRGMNPQIIAVDEIAREADIQAVTMAAGCGAALLATVHGADPAELHTRPLYRELLRSCVFEKAVVIRRTEEGRIYRVEDLIC